VKHLSETFTDEEFDRLRRGKGDRSWREALLDELAEDMEDTDGSLE